MPSDLLPPFQMEGRPRGRFLIRAISARRRVWAGSLGLFTITSFSAVHLLLFAFGPVVFHLAHF